MTTTEHRSGTVATVRRLTRRPDGVAEGVRWLFTWLALLSLLFSLPGAFSTAGNGVIFPVLAAVSAVVLATSWIDGYLRQRVPVMLDLIDAAAITGFALAGPAPYAAAGVLFAAVWLRSLYGSLWRALLRCVLYSIAYVGSAVLWPLIPGHSPVAGIEALLPSVSIMFLTVVVVNQLSTLLMAHDWAIRRDRALAGTSSQLLGATDPGAIHALARTAVAEVCGATAGLRVLRLVRNKDTLQVEHVAGRFQSPPATLPSDVIDTGAAAAGARIGNAKALTTAAGTTLTWDCIALPQEDRSTWLVIGAPKHITVAVMLSLHTLVNQVSLALRNSDVHEQLRVEAQFDSLTGLANRSSFTAQLTARLAQPSLSTSLHVLFLDLDDFKDVNDLWGHNAGDSVLAAVAHRLRECTRPDDVCARLGGDEFGIMLVDSTMPDAQGVARRIVESIARPFEVGDHVVRVHASAGVAAANRLTDVDELVHHADLAMYAAKANGKGRVHVFESGLLRQAAADPS